MYSLTKERSFHETTYSLEMGNLWKKNFFHETLGSVEHESYTFKETLKAIVKYKKNQEMIGPRIIFNTNAFQISL
jgi:hypothetical protein